ncbi:MAG: methyltransferase domain-containing protein [Candidatus Aenigmatarchaeota archaeon]|nr:class I SAM-dependent methyltransferase [Nanoarchaeota archaeon]
MAMEKVATGFRKMIGYDSMVYNILEPHVDGKVLSIGCGEGKMENLLRKRKGIQVEGVEVTKYKNSHIPVRMFDGKKIPAGNKAFDNTLFVYVLHHSNNMEELLTEAIRVSKDNIIILDHVYNNTVSKSLLGFYDYASNLWYRMPIPYNFLKMGEWRSLFNRLDVEVEEAYTTSPLNVFFKLKITNR